MLVRVKDVISDFRPCLHTPPQAIGTGDAALSPRSKGKVGSAAVAGGPVKQPQLAERRCGDRSAHAKAAPGVVGSYSELGMRRSAAAGDAASAASESVGCVAGTCVSTPGPSPSCSSDNGVEELGSV